MTSLEAAALIGNVVGEIAAMLIALGILVWFLRRQEKREQEGHPPKESIGVPVEETPEGQLYAHLAKKGCPDCGSGDFYEGPRGGMSMNVKCVNCGSKFNVTPGIGIAHRI